MENKKQLWAVHFGNSPFKTAPLVGPDLGMVFGLALMVLGFVLLTVMAVWHPVAGMSLAVFPALVEKQNLLRVKREELKKAFDEAGETVDLAKVKTFGATMSVEAVREEIRRRTKELDDIGLEIDGLADLEQARQKARMTDPEKGRPGIHPEGKGSEGGERKTLGEHIISHEKFKGWNPKGGPISLDLDIYPSDLKSSGMKTLFETGAGWAPESTRMGLVVDKATRPVEILQIIPSGRTGQAAVVYMEETTRTHNAAEKAEGSAYAESAFVLTEASVTVRKLTDSIPVTDEQMEDVPQVEGYLTNRLLFGIRQKLDSQIINGSTVAPQLNGILATSGIQTQALGALSVLDALYKAMDLVNVTGRAIASHFIIHPTDWQAVRLLKDTTGQYIYGGPVDSGPATVWGLPYILSTAITENTGLVGDFRNFCQLFERKGVTIALGFVGDNFKEGKKTMRADMRVAMVWTRPAAFCTITGI